MSEQYFEVPLRTILDDYIRRRLDGSSVRRFPLTGQPLYDDWLDIEKSVVVFRIYPQDGEG